MHTCVFVYLYKRCDALQLVFSLLRATEYITTQPCVCVRVCAYGCTLRATS